MRNYQFITLVVLILIGIGSTHYIISKIPEKVTANILTIEYAKVGGMENYVKLNKIQRQQTELFLKQYEAQNGKIQTSQVNTKNNVLNSQNKISKDIIEKIKQGAYILGDKDAEVSWVVYSDLECPYCKKLHENGSIEKILKDYSGKVNFIYKQFPLPGHPKAQIEAEAALCVGELAGSNKYYDFIKDIYKNSLSNGNSYNKDSLISLAKKLGVDKVKMSGCLTSRKYSQEAQRQMQEGNKLFGIRGTPGNVFINNKTGEFRKFSGAYSYNSIKSVVDSLIK